MFVLKSILFSVFQARKLYGKARERTGDRSNMIVYQLNSLLVVLFLLLNKTAIQ